MCDAPIDRARSLSADIRPKHVISDRLINFKIANYINQTRDSEAIYNLQLIDFIDTDKATILSF